MGGAGQRSSGPRGCGHRVALSRCSRDARRCEYPRKRGRAVGRVRAGQGCGMGSSGRVSRPPPWQRLYLRAGVGRRCEAEGGAAARAASEGASHGRGGEGAAGSVSNRRRGGLGVQLAAAKFGRNAARQARADEESAWYASCGCQAKAVGERGVHWGTWGTVFQKKRTSEI